MLLHVDVNKDASSDFLFCVLRPAKHKRRRGHNLQGAHFLNALTDVPITSRKLELKLQTFTKQ